MTARFADVLEISLAMSVVLAVLLALRPLLKKRLRAGAFYWVWLLAALRLCIPFNLSLPQAPVTVEAVPRAVYRVDTVNSNPGNHHYAALTEEEAASEEAAAENRPVDGGSIQDVYTPLFTLEGAVAALWLAGAGAFRQNTSASACGCAAGGLRRRTPPCWRGLRLQRRSWG